MRMPAFASSTGKVTTVSDGTQSFRRLGGGAGPEPRDGGPDECRARARYPAPDWERTGRGGRQLVVATAAGLTGFNPRPPRGGRHVCAHSGPPPVRFQSAPPARGATDQIEADYARYRVSIRAPRAGGDPRDAPAGRGSGFQSAPPARGATIGVLRIPHDIVVSIRAPRAGGDSATTSTHADPTRFNPRPPRGGRPVV